MTFDLTPFIFIFPSNSSFFSHYQDSFSKTQNHLCSCAYHPKILTCEASVLLLNVDTCVLFEFLLLVLVVLVAYYVRSTEE